MLLPTFWYPGTTYACASTERSLAKTFYQYWYGHYIEKATEKEKKVFLPSIPATVCMHASMYSLYKNELHQLCRLVLESVYKKVHLSFCLSFFRSPKFVDMYNRAQQSCRE